MIGWVLLLAACLVGGPAHASRPRWQPVWTGMPQIGQRYVVAGIVGCTLASGPPKAIARVAFNGATGYYLFEGGDVFVLR